MILKTDLSQVWQPLPETLAHGWERRMRGGRGRQLWAREENRMEGLTEILWSDSDKCKHENDAERGVGVRKVFYVQGI